MYTYIHTHIHKKTSTGSCSLPLIYRWFNFMLKHTYTHIHTYIHICIYTYIHTYIHTWTDLHRFLQPAADVQIVLLYVDTYIHIHTYTHIHTHTYIHTYMNRPQRASAVCHWYKDCSIHGALRTIEEYIHTIHTYIYTYIHTYIHEQTSTGFCSLPLI